MDGLRVPRFEFTRRCRTFPQRGPEFSLSCSSIASAGALADQKTHLGNQWDDGETRGARMVEKRQFSLRAGIFAERPVETMPSGDRSFAH